MENKIKENTVEYFQEKLYLNTTSTESIIDLLIIKIDKEKYLIEYYFNEKITDKSFNLSLIKKNITDKSQFISLEKLVNQLELSKNYNFFNSITEAQNYIMTFAKTNNLYYTFRTLEN